VALSDFCERYCQIKDIGGKTMKEEKVIELSNGVKITAVFEMAAGNAISMEVKSLDIPKKPEYRYTKMGLPNVLSESTPVLWKKNKDGLPIYLKLVHYTDTRNDPSTTLVMCDAVGRMLESGCLLKFFGETGEVKRVPMVSDQYPGYLISGDVAKVFPERRGAMEIGVLPISMEAQNA